jgi:hypothetical protein
VISINVILAAVGFVVGVVIGIAVFALVIEGKRGGTYQLMAIRHPWIRSLPILWIVACGVGVALVAYRLAD